MLNPTWFGEVLSERLLCDADGLAMTVEDNGARRGGTLVKRHDEFVLHTHSSSSEWGMLKNPQDVRFFNVENIVFFTEHTQEEQCPFLLSV